MRLPLVPRERRFYDLFDQQAVAIVDGARLLVEMLEQGTDPKGYRARIKDCEHRGDDVTHEIVRTLNKTFVTPFDREDIYALSSGLDDVLDYVDEVADTLILYRIGKVPEPAIRMAGLVLDAALQLQDAVSRLQALRGMEDCWIEVHRLENLGDTVSREAIGALFEGGIDVLEVVRLKDFYALLEAGLDRCEDVANVLESITIKNA